MSIAELPLSDEMLFDTVEKGYIPVDDSARLERAAFDFYSQFKSVLNPFDIEESDVIDLVYESKEYAIISIEEPFSKAAFENSHVDDEDVQRALSCWMTTSTAELIDYTHGGRYTHGSFLIPAEWIDRSE